MREISRLFADFPIAGMKFWDGALVLEQLKVGEGLTLAAEPDNHVDPDAIALYRNNTKLGYVPRDQNELVAKFLNLGHDDVFECRILKVDPYAEPWNQVRVGLYIVDKNKG